MKPFEPDQPEKLQREDEDELDVRVELIPKDPRRLEALWDAIIAGTVGGTIGGVIAALIVQAL